MYGLVRLMAASALAGSTLAFQGTAPLIAWSSSPSADLSLLLPPSYRPTSQLSLSSKSPSLCPPSSSTTGSSLDILLVPSLADLASLPPTVKALYAESEASARVKLGFVSEKQAGDMARRALASWLDGTCEGSVKVRTVDAVDDIEGYVDPLATLTIVTGHPLTLLDRLPSGDGASPLLARQLPSVSDTFSAFAPNSSSNGTMPSPDAGLLFRYRFFSPYLLVSIGVVLVILIPAMLLGSYALTGIEAPLGLNQKMTGSIGEVKS